MQLEGRNGVPWMDVAIGGPLRKVQKRTRQQSRGGAAILKGSHFQKRKKSQPVKKNMKSLFILYSCIILSWVFSMKIQDETQSGIVVKALLSPGIDNVCSTAQNGTECMRLSFGHSCIGILFMSMNFNILLLNVPCLPLPPSRKSDSISTQGMHLCTMYCWDSGSVHAPLQTPLTHQPLHNIGMRQWLWQVRATLIQLLTLRRRQTTSKIEILPSAGTSPVNFQESSLTQSPLCPFQLSQKKWAPIISLLLVLAICFYFPIELWIFCSS